MSSDEHATHGFQIKNVMDGVSRSISVMKSNYSRYQVRIETQSPDEPLIVTEVKFSSVGFALLVDAVMEAATNLESYPVISEEVEGE